MTSDPMQHEVGAAIVHSGADPEEDVLIRLYNRRVRGEGYEPVGVPTVHPKELFKETTKRILYITRVTGLARKIMDHDTGAPMDDCEIHGDSNELDDVREVVWNNGGVMKLCSTCRGNHAGEWTEVE